MITFKIQCYPGTNSENNLTVKIGTMAEIAPDDVNYDPKTTYGFEIETDRDGTLGLCSYGYKDYFKTQAAAMLQAVCYGNGGFPLESLIR